VNPLKWRKMTWLFNIVNLVFLIWIIGGASTSSGCANNADVKAGIISKDLCESAANAGKGIGVGLIILLWFLVFVVLSIIWFMTRPKNRACPVCGHDVKKGITACGKCGHDFARAATAPSQIVRAET
jgi:hypothetical protein